MTAQTPDSSSAVVPSSCAWVESFQSSTPRFRGFSLWAVSLGALLLCSALPTMTRADKTAAQEVATESAPTQESATESASAQEVATESAPAMASTAAAMVASVAAEVVADVAASVVAPPEEPVKVRFSVAVSGHKRAGEVAASEKLTVGEALKALNITLGPLDRVTPLASTLVSTLEGKEIVVRVQRVSNEVEKRRVHLPAPTEVRFRPTTDLKAGTQKVAQEARGGVQEVSERVWKLDGKVTKRDVVSKKTVSAPQPKVVALGVYSHLKPGAPKPHRRYARALGARPLSARGGSPRSRGRSSVALNTSPSGTYKIAKSLTVSATGYSAGPAGGALSNWTATGVRCTLGAVAVDPRIIPLGSRLYIEGYGYGFACDTGGAIKGNKIDLAFNAPRAAFAWGRRKVKVHILAP